jgi:hypothetical protein
VDFRAWNSAGDSFGLFGVDVAYRDYLGADELVRKSADVLLADHSHANYADLQCHVRFLPFARLFGGRGGARRRGSRFRRIADAIVAGLTARILDNERSPSESPAHEAL